MTQRLLHVDCFAGISGDMFLGALIDLGYPMEQLCRGLSQLGLDKEFHLHASHVNRCGIQGVKLDVHPTDAAHQHSPTQKSVTGTHPHHHIDSGHSHPHAHAHPHDHEPHSHEHGRNFSEIRKIIESSALSERVKSQSVGVFERIAIAEGKIHGLPPSDVAFHEVGAIDSIVDIVGVTLGLEFFEIDRITFSPLIEGSGHIHCAHGVFPLPAPATLEILNGIPLTQVPEAGERITPTGAAFAAFFGESFSGMPGMAVEKIGYGAGTRNPHHRPNVLRLLLGQSAESSPPSTEESIIELHSNLDDCTPELIAALCAKLLDRGVLEVFTTPVVMKKGRLGTLLTVLLHDSLVPEAESMLLTESSTFGVRKHTVRRKILQRRIEAVETSFGSVQVKVGLLCGRIVQATPEFESCKAVAAEKSVPLRDVMLAAQAAASRLLTSS